MENNRTYCLFPKGGASEADQVYAHMVKGSTGQFPVSQIGPVKPGTSLALAAELLLRQAAHYGIKSVLRIADKLRGEGLIFTMSPNNFLDSGIRDIAVQAGYLITELEAAK